MADATTTAAAVPAVTTSNFKMTVPNYQLGLVVLMLQDLGIVSLKQTTKLQNTVFEGELTEAEATAIKNKVQVMSLKNTVKSIVYKTGGLVADTADVVVNDVAVPVARVGFQTAASVGRIGAKAVVLSASGIVNSVAEEGGRALHDIKCSAECNEAKEHLASAKSKLFGFLGFASGNDQIKIG